MLLHHPALLATLLFSALMAIWAASAHPVEGLDAPPVSASLPALDDGARLLPYETVA